MTATNKTLTLRLSDPDVLEALAALERQYNVGTSSAAIQLAIRDHARLRERAAAAQREAHELRKRLSGITTAWNNHHRWWSLLEEEIDGPEKPGEGLK